LERGESGLQIQTGYAPYRRAQQVWVQSGGQGMSGPLNYPKKWEKCEHRSYPAELEWVLGQMRIAFHDRNPSRQSHVDALIDYAGEVGIARRSKLPFPERPDLSKHI
jgi:hypothetical protein